jgi:hypothetical protein
MPPNVSSPPVSMSTLNIISLPISIYEPSSLTFLNDTQAYTTVDINQSKLTKVSWCV